MLRQQSQSQSADTKMANPYLVDHLQFMQQQEETHHRARGDYLLPSSVAVTAADRRSMCAWSFKIVHACALRRETACVGISYFDRFLATPSAGAKRALGSRRAFQLAFIACLVVALKCRAGMKVEARFVSDSLCQGLYPAEELLREEREVLHALDWRVGGPGPHDFVSGFVALLPTGAGAAAVDRWRAAACARAEEAMLDYASARQAPSAVAYDALTAALHDLGTGPLRPLDRLAWMQKVARVMGKRVEDLGGRGGKVMASRSPASPSGVLGRRAACPVRTTLRRANTDGGGTPRPTKEGAFSQCSPISPADAAAFSDPQN